MVRKPSAKQPARDREHLLNRGTWRVIPDPVIAGTWYGVVVVEVGASHDTHDDRQHEMVETAPVGREGTGSPDASAIFAILDAAPAIGAGTKGAGQHLGVIDKKPVLLLQPPEGGPSRTVGFGERSTEP